ncbi:hypothetical protein DFH29DRAFT_133386 [Suillus ampliporus]|nr:hypothetical protein DFH29DRAFT_133386 [Suillus ampliporus]
MTMLALMVYSGSSLSAWPPSMNPLPLTKCIRPNSARSEDSKSFDYFLFGVRSASAETSGSLISSTSSHKGILGDVPPRDRTSELLQLGFPSCHLAPAQMTTDTALGVTKRLVDGKVQMNVVPYIVRRMSIHGHNEQSWPILV